MMRKSFYDSFLVPVLSKKDSDDIAFCISGKVYTYKQLYDAIEQVYSLISELSEDLIGLYATDDIRTYASIISLWCSGKTYIPLNPQHPKEKQANVMRSIGSHYIISSVEKFDIGIDNIEMISTKDVSTEYYVRKNILKVKDVRESALAYIIFTSGSTGMPKGVELTRGNVAAFIDSMNNIGLDISSKDKCLQPFDLTFDFSVSGYVIPLVKGASIYTVPIKAMKFSYIAGLLEDYKLTILQMVPSMIRNMLPYKEEIQLKSVRCNIICGEALAKNVLEEWHEGNPQMESYNMYGPTENTVFCTFYRVSSDNIGTFLTNNGVISIGKTFKNSGFLLIDDNGDVITKNGQEGELCLCGSQLSPGYWDNERENKAKFLNLNGVVYYRTGDLCYYGEDNNLMYVSRKDFQVKINGFRVELGEIEYIYSSITNGRFSVIIPYINEQGNMNLAIVIEGEEYNYKADKATLARKLPSYEIPSKWLFTRIMPLNTNGKIDRNALRQQFNLNKS